MQRTDRTSRIGGWLPVFVMLTFALASGACKRIELGTRVVSGGGEGAVATGSAEARYGLHYEPVAFDPPQVNRAKLANGISLHHYAEREVPLVTVLVRVAAGSVDDPAGKVGCAQMAGETIRNGGSKTLAGDDLDRELESRGALLTVSNTREETWFRLSVLPEDLDWGVGVLANLLAEPALPAEKLDEARARALVGLRQRLDVPRDAARALFPQLIMGKGNPWGWTETEKTLASLTVDDLRAFYERNYRVGLMLGMSGDVDFETAQALARRHFGGERFPATAQRQRMLPQVRDVDATRIYIVPRAGSQSVIYFGHEGIGRFDEDKYAARIFNEVLSGGFSARLLTEVRSNRGLAYLVGARIQEGTVKGLYFNIALTKTETTLETLRLMVELNEQLRREAPSIEEVELARQSTVNSFVFLFETAEGILTQKMTLDYFDYPEDYLAGFTGSITAVTGGNVRAAAERILHLDRLTVLIFGEIGAEQRKELEKLGPVTEIAEEELRAEWL
jgi:zinc protease